MSPTNSIALPPLPDARAIIARAWADGLRPADEMPISRWAEENLRLGTRTANPGRFRIDRTPYIAGPMDSMSPTSLAKVVSMVTATQLGKTTLALAVAAYYSVQVPSMTMITLPSKDVAAEWSKTRLTPLFDDSPALNGTLRDEADRKTRAENGIFAKVTTAGGAIKFAWSTSKKLLRSTPVKIAIDDEVDAYDGDTQGEGDPVKLIEKRITNFQGAKMLNLSSPAPVKGTSRIIREFERGDQRYYFVPCPHCEHFQRLVFSRLRWAENDPETAIYRCAACDREIAEIHKTQMLARGKWVATADHPELRDSGFSASDLALIETILDTMPREQFHSFHLSALYSPIGWYSWADAARAWLDAQDDPPALKVFVETVLAEPWVERGDAPDDEILHARKAAYPKGTAPREAVFLTAGVDVQEDRFEVEVVGWGATPEGHRQRYSVDYRIIPGDTNQPETWAKLDNLLAAEWPTARHAELTMPIAALAIDTGYRSDQVYAFARRHPQPHYDRAGVRIYTPRTVVCTKGKSDFDRLIVNVSSDAAARDRGGIRVYSVGTGYAKLELIGALKMPLPAAGSPFPVGYCHFPANYDRDYFQGLCSESLVTLQSGKREFRKDPSRRNEPFDCAILARVAAGLYGVDLFSPAKWKALDERLQPAPPVSEQPARSITRALAPITNDDPYLS